MTSQIERLAKAYNEKIELYLLAKKLGADQSSLKD